MGKIDKLGDKDSEDSTASELAETNGSEKMSLLKQMLLAGIDQRQKQDEIRRTQTCIERKVEDVTQQKDEDDNHQEIEDASKNGDGGKKSMGGGKQKAEAVKRKVDGVKQKSESVREKTEVVPTEVRQTTPSNTQQKKRRKPKSNDELHKKEKKRSEAKDEAEEEAVIKKKVAKEKEAETVARKTVKAVKEKEEEENDEESEESESEEENLEVQYSPLSLCLETLHRNLQRKDVQGVFSFPNTDSDAPAYSDVIKKHMDFLTMSRKISEQKYNSFGEFRNDFVLMCGNAMLYNKSESVQYQSAKKLLTDGLEMLSNKKLRNLSASIGVSFDDTMFTQYKALNNVNISKQDTVSTMNNDEQRSRLQLKRRREDRQAVHTASFLSSARKAWKSVMNKQSNQVYGDCLTMKPALKIINPDTQAEEVPERCRIGYKRSRKLVHGHIRKQEGSEEKNVWKNNVTPVNYLLYGPYGSFGPIYDTSLSNLTKDESDTLLYTYASNNSHGHLNNVLAYVEDNHVDKILNILGSEHNRSSTLVGESQVGVQMETKSNGTFLKIDQSKNKFQEDRQTTIETRCLEETMEISDGNIKRGTKTSDEGTVEDVSVNLDLTDVLTLDRLGIDVSFLKDMVNSSHLCEKNSENRSQNSQELVKSKLSQNSELLYALKQSQYCRLSTANGGGNDIPACEIKAAVSITDNLKQLIGMVTPNDVVSSQAVRNAIGVGKNN